jgi:hypothetical protein
MIINFRIREISRGTHKLTRTLIIIIKKYIPKKKKTRPKAEFAPSRNFARALFKMKIFLPRSQLLS